MILVTPVIKFIVTLSKVGYLGIKNILDKAKVNYSRVSVVLASNLKNRFEELDINRDGAMIESVDAVNIYLQSKFQESENRWYKKRNTTAATKNTSNLCLELVSFGMSSILISFDGEYYEYHGSENEEQGLTMGWYELAFLEKLCWILHVWESRDPYEPGNLPWHLLRWQSCGVQSK